MSELDNPLTRNAFAGASYQDVLDWYEETGFGDRATPDDFNMYQEEQALEGLTQSDTGHYYNEEGERVYVYQDSAELGDDSGGLAGQALVMRTESEIREAWEADEGMGYFKEANPDLDFDSYMAFIAEKDDMYASGALDINPHDDLYNVGHKGRGPNADAINDILDQEKAARAEERDSLNAELYSKYGIQTEFRNDDGDTFKFNGSTYTKTDKIDDHMGVGDYVKMGAMALMSIYAAPLIAGSLTGVAGMSASAATAMSKAIVSTATQYMSTGEVDLGQALLSAAGSYGMDKVSALEGSLGGILDTVGEATSKFEELISTGNSIADAAIKAGGMSMLTQLVMEGEVDATQAGIAALMAGGTQAFSEYAQSITDLGGEEPVLEEVVVDAKRKGEDLGNGMTNYEGMVFNSDNELVGYMDDIDLNGDGALDNNDLQNITTPPRDLADPTYEGNDNVYGDVDLNAPDSTINPTFGTGEFFDERYGGITDPDQLRDALNQGGFLDTEEGQEWYSNRVPQLELLGDEYDLATYGEIEVDMSKPYTIGETAAGTKYIARVGEDGSVVYTSVTEEQYDELYSRIYSESSDEYGPPELGANNTGDYSYVEEYMGEQGIGSTGYEIGDYKPDGTLVGDLNDDGVISSDELQAGDATYTEGDGWITLEDPTPPAVPIDMVDEEVPPPEETVEQHNNDDSAANADPNDSADLGQGDPGGGASDALGGAGSEGQSGGLSGNPADGGPTSGTSGDLGTTIPGFVLPDLTNPLLDDADSPNDNADGSNPNADNGDGLGGDNPDSTQGGSTDSTDGTGGVNNDDGTTDGNNQGGDIGGNTGTSDQGSESGQGETGDNAGSGDTGGSVGNEAGSDQGTNGGINGGNSTGGSVGPGVGTGTAPGAGGGAGGGGLGGDGEGGGMMSGHNPSWGELYGYTPFDVYKPGKGLEPIQGLLKGYI